MDLFGFEPVYDGGYFKIWCYILESGVKIFELVTKYQSTAQRTISVSVNQDEVKEIIESNGDVKIIRKIITTQGRNISFVDETNNG